MLENQKTYYQQYGRLYLREVRTSDVNNRYYTWMNDPEVNQYLETRFYPRSLDDIRGFVTAMDGKANEVFFAICLKENDLHIGNIKVGPINWVHRYADVSLLIGDKNYWGKGLATEAIAAVTEFAFRVLNLNKLKAGCYAENQGSAKAFEKVGFDREGLIKKVFFSNGAYQDHILLGICKDDWDRKQLKAGE